MAPASRVVLGEVLGPHGRRGALRVRIHGEDAHHLTRATRVEIGDDPEDAHAVEYGVREVGSGRPGEARLVLDGVGDREAAEALGGLLVLLDVALLDPLPDGEFYWYELIGCEVYDEEGRSLGRLSGLLETGAHDVFVVEREDATQRLFPAAEALLREVDPHAPAGGRIVIAVPEARSLSDSLGAWLTPRNSPSAAG